MAKKAQRYEMMYHSPNPLPDPLPEPREPARVHDRLADVLGYGGFCTMLAGGLVTAAIFFTALEIQGPWTEMYTWGFSLGGGLLAVGALAMLLSCLREKRVQRRAREEFDRG